MKNIPLLPRYFRWIGIFLFLIGFSYHLLQYFDENLLPLNTKTFVFYADGPQFDKAHWLSLLELELGLTFILTSYLVGLTFIAFTRNRVEDEMINSIRLYSWSWAIILTLIFCFLSTTFIYGLAYLSISFMYIELMLIIYIVLFWVNIWKMNRRLAHEE